MVTLVNSRTHIFNCTFGIFITFLFLFSVKYLPQFNSDESQLNQIIDAAMYFVNICTCWIFLLFILFTIMFPRGNVFMSELIPIQYYSFFPIGLLITLFHVQLIISMFFNFCLETSLFLTYLYYISVFVLVEFTLGSNAYRTKAEFRNGQNLVVTFRSLQLLNGKMMSLVGKTIVYCHSAFMLVPIYSCVTSITYWNEIGLLAKGVLGTTGFCLFCTWLVVLHLGKFMHLGSVAMLLSWKRANWRNRCQSKEMAKFRKSCHLIQLRCEKILVVRRITPILYVKGVAKGTFRSLLTLTMK